MIISIALAVPLAAAVWLLFAARSRAATLAVRLEERDREVSLLREEQRALQAGQRELHELRSARAGLVAELAHERRSAGEKQALLEDAQKRFSEAFDALSKKALQSNNAQFLQLAGESLARFQDGARGDLDKRQQAIVDLVRPVRESLDKVDGKLRDLEVARTGAYASLTTQVRSLLTETGKLSQALRAPQVRGRWGEIQLRRVVEMAGMLEHCDFHEQPTGEDGRLRPDLVVKLPGRKNVVVDAKAPLQSYLDAIDAPDDAARALKLADHGRQIRAHMTSLSRKAYWEQFVNAPEFVILFLPNEAMLSAALEHDPALIEAGVEERVILATPTTLIALLRAVAYGWRQESLAENAQAISALGRELYKRICDMAGHLGKVGKSLGSSVEAYNAAIGSLERRVLVSARKLKELEASPPELELDSLPPVEELPRTLHAGELAASKIPDDAN